MDYPNGRGASERRLARRLKPFPAHSDILFFAACSSHSLRDASSTLHVTQEELLAQSKFNSLSLPKGGDLRADTHCREELVSRGGAQGLQGRWSQLEAERLRSCWGRRTHSFPRVAGRLTSIVSTPKLGDWVPVLVGFFYFCLLHLTENVGSLKSIS